MSNDEQKTTKDEIIKQVTIPQYFNVLPIEYISKMEEVFGDHLISYLDELTKSMHLMGWSVEKCKLFAETHFKEIDVCKESALDKVEDYFKQNVFVMPNNLNALDDGKLQRAMDSYSKEDLKEEDLDEKLLKLIEGTKAKKAFIKALKAEVDKNETYLKLLSK